jgi:probable F420-dependent oxidoreductase
VKLGLLPTYRSSVVASPDYALGVARACEEVGLESIWAVEHVVVPEAYSSRYPYAPDGRMPLTGDDAIPDPLDWLAFVAAGTTTLRLGTAMVILPEHHPVELAKRLATIDTLSHGRLLLGIGVGWMREEAEAVGTRFEDRGARTDEYIAVLRELWREPVASFHGRTVAFDRVKCLPKPVQPGGVPILVGGHSPAAARRAGRVGDGFFPLGVGVEELPALLELMAGAARDAGRDPDAIELTTNAPRDQETASRLVDLGVSRFVMSAHAQTDVPAVRDFVEATREKLQAWIPS